MSSITAPTLLPQDELPPPTPADKWAQDTTTALHSASRGDTESGGSNGDLAAKTPMVRLPSSGPSPPGGYPLTAEDYEQHAHEGGLETSPKEVLASTGAQIIDAAKQYIPQAQQAIVNAGQAAKAYLPAAVAAYIRSSHFGRFPCTDKPICSGNDQRRLCRRVAAHF
jgi:hypothetical protein